MFPKIQKKKKTGKAIPGTVLMELRRRSLDMCEAAMIGCGNFAVDAHHIKSRARGGSNTVKNLLHLCRQCHQKITDNMPGTERFRTHRWQEEGIDENGTRFNS